MENWFECKIKYETIDEYGKQKPVSESYMVDAVSFTEAESRLHYLLKESVPEDFVVNGIAKSKLSEIVPNQDTEGWYKAKVIFKDVDEKSGKEKSIGNQILVAADDFRQALDNLEKSLDSIVIPWEIQAISLTKVVDVFPYESEETQIREGNFTPISETDRDESDPVSEEN